MNVKSHPILHKIPVPALQGLVSVVEGLDYTGSGFAESPIPPVNNMNPRDLIRVSIKYLAGRVGRSIVYDHPFGGLHGLIDD